VVPVEVVIMIVVDYGVKRVALGYKVDQGNNWLEKDRWCIENFKLGEYHRCGLYFYFEKEKHLMWFLLRWS
jgi:hypothetical protein